MLLQRRLMPNRFAPRHYWRLVNSVARRSRIPLHVTEFNAKSGVAEFLIVGSDISFCFGNTTKKTSSSQSLSLVRFWPCFLFILCFTHLVNFFNDISLLCYFTCVCHPFIMATERKKLTILEKVKIIHEVENNQNTPAIEIARKFNGRK
jgi:hypothetical protein